jgi:hypothetical protein
MLYPHSLLWHYLWVGLDVLLLVLALVTWRQLGHELQPQSEPRLRADLVLLLALSGTPKPCLNR